MCLRHMQSVHKRTQGIIWCGYRPLACLRNEPRLHCGVKLQLIKASILSIVRMRVWPHDDQRLEKNTAQHSWTLWTQRQGGFKWGVRDVNSVNVILFNPIQTPKVQVVFFLNICIRYILTLDSDHLYAVGWQQSALVCCRLRTG